MKDKLQYTLARKYCGLSSGWKVLEVLEGVILALDKQYSTVPQLDKRSIYEVYLYECEEVKKPCSYVYGYI